MQASRLHHDAVYQPAQRQIETRRCADLQFPVILIENQSRSRLWSIFLAVRSITAATFILKLSALRLPQAAQAASSTRPDQTRGEIQHWKFCWHIEIMSA